MIYTTYYIIIVGILTTSYYYLANESKHKAVIYISLYIISAGKST